MAGKNIIKNINFDYYSDLENCRSLPELGVQGLTNNNSESNSGEFFTNLPSKALRFQASLKRSQSKFSRNNHGGY